MAGARPAMTPEKWINMTGMRSRRVVLSTYSHQEDQMSSDDLARHVALRLGSELDRNLPAVVEARLQGGSEAPKRYEAAATIALATFILSAAKFAWDIYRDLKKDSKAAPPPDVIARRMRLELNVAEEIDIARRDKIITVVVDELMKHPPEA